MGTFGQTGLTAYVGVHLFGKPRESEVVFVSAAAGTDLGAYDHDVDRTESYRPVKRSFEIVTFRSFHGQVFIRNNVICQNMFPCKSSRSNCTLGPALRYSAMCPFLNCSSWRG